MHPGPDRDMHRAGQSACTYGVCLPFRRRMGRRRLRCLGACGPDRATPRGLSTVEDEPKAVDQTYLEPSGEDWSSKGAVRSAGVDMAASTEVSAGRRCCVGEDAADAQRGKTAEKRWGLADGRTTHSAYTHTHEGSPGIHTFKAWRRTDDAVSIVARLFHTVSDLELHGYYVCSCLLGVCITWNSQLWGSPAAGCWPTLPRISTAGSVGRRLPAISKSVTRRELLLQLSSSPSE